MSKIVVTHHAHHANEGVYRLVVAEETKHARVVEHENPDFNADEPVSEDNHPTLVEREVFAVHANHREVVWDAEDERWQGREPEEIALEQRQIVKKALAKQARTLKRAAKAAEDARTDLDGVGTEL